MTIHSETPAHDLSRLRIDRDAPPRLRWLPWAALVVLAAGGAMLYPRVRSYLAARQAPEVEVAPVTRLVSAPGGSPALPVLVATGYVVARHSSDVGVKTGGRIETLRFEEGTRVRRGEVIAQIEHADIEAQLEAAQRAVAEADAQRAQAIAARDEDVRNLERQRALAKDGITTTANLTAAEAAAAVSDARVKSAEAAIASARARVKVADEALENTNVRAPFDGVVIKKRAEVGETVSPFGVQGQASREGGAIATIADLHELEVQTEVSENSFAKLTSAMPADVTLQAYQDQHFKGRLRQIFPSADRAKSIVEVRVSILDPDEHVKPEMTATVTFQERPTGVRPASDVHGTSVGRTSDVNGTSAGRTSDVNGTSTGRTTDVILAPKKAVTEDKGRTFMWVVSGGTATRRPVTLGADRIDQIEVTSGVLPGETVIVNAPAGLADRAPVRVKGT